MPSRNSKLWKLQNNSVEIDPNNIDIIKVDETNLVPILFTINKDQIDYKFMMDLFGNFNDKVLCRPYDLLEVPVGKFSYYTDMEKTKSVKNTTPFTTTVGIFIYNILLRDFNFSRLFNGYYQDSINSKQNGKIEKVLSYALIEDKITTDDLKNWEDTMQWLMPFETILSPAHTEKMLSCSKAIDKKKAELVKKYKKEIDEGDPVVINNIEKELLEYAKEYMGDDPSMDTVYSGAVGDFDNNFKNIYVMKGAVRDPDPNAKKKYSAVLGNYIDGIPAEEYSLVAGGATYGAYSRSKKTEVGGYYEKLFVAAFQHLKLDPPGSDCGTTNHIEVNLTEDNIDDYMYSYIIQSNGSLELLDTSTRSKYINKKVKFRFSSMCKSKTGICNKCAGELFYKINNPKIGPVLSNIPDRLKLSAMKSFHNATVQITQMPVYSTFYPFED